MQNLGLHLDLLNESLDFNTWRDLGGSWGSGAGVEVGLQGLWGMKLKWRLRVNRLNVKKKGQSGRGTGLACTGVECLELCS